MASLWPYAGLGASGTAYDMNHAVKGQKATDAFVLPTYVKMARYRQCRPECKES